MNFFKRFLDKYTGNQTVFSNKYATQFFTAFPRLAFLNNVTNLAPMMKWSLSVVPITQIVSGTKPPQSIDVYQASSLCATGSIWTYYATLIQPQNTGTRMLAMCNAAMAACHGYNIYRRVQYDKGVASGEIAAAPAK
ncbi:hypothetical protein DICPUDRAFT_53816 [Dictyostelium purpureum]|uniref:Mitochondrial pyruvate carrier n=1 Tax=Dictyostelium purpureum TaxID=5786 RepID=F0ZED4_DICPU|nr:uncharacterized protein DICPUDRAFT_53816 [Dictyostelium purpureum]EGC37696.1 hypothetical protein DICPUDRAFT_53816 [Dictyostelium purpureum]|eukprot:XP_003285800.1 hypothetical protein DICPUDRAFT_53816 [Dictyostelium purpureum]